MKMIFGNIFPVASRKRSREKLVEKTFKKMLTKKIESDMIKHVVLDEVATE